MELTENDSRRGRLVRSALAVVLGGVAIRSLRKGNRLRGTVAGVGALALGHDAMAGSGELAEVTARRATDEDVDLRCAICGEPIRPGQMRGPNEDNEIVHESCREMVEQ